MEALVACLQLLGWMAFGRSFYHLESILRLFSPSSVRLSHKLSLSMGFLNLVVWNGKKEGGNAGSWQSDGLQHIFPRFVAYLGVALVQLRREVL